MALSLPVSTQQLPPMQQYMSEACLHPDCPAGKESGLRSPSWALFTAGTGECEPEPARVCVCGTEASHPSVRQRTGRLMESMAPPALLPPQVKASGDTVPPWFSGNQSTGRCARRKTRTPPPDAHTLRLSEETLKPTFFETEPSLIKSELPSYQHTLTGPSFRLSS